MSRPTAGCGTSPVHPAVGIALGPLPIAPIVELAAAPPALTGRVTLLNFWGTWCPKGGFAWCVNELDLTVTGFAYDAAAGTLTEIESLSTLPADVTDRTGFSTAEIAVHPSGRFLYASNRGHDSIATYAIAEATGRLTFLGVEPTRCKTPRNFAIAPGGSHLLAAGQDSDTVAVFAIDPATGKLSFTGRSVAVPAPVCVLFRRQ